MADLSRSVRGRKHPRNPGQLDLVGQNITYDPYTKAMLHFNDLPDGSTVFNDEIGGRIWSPVGNAQIDTSQYKFGGASLLLDGTGDYISYMPAAELVFGSQNWTIDFQIRLNSIGSRFDIITQDNVGNTDRSLTLLWSSNNITLVMSNNGTSWADTFSFPWTPSTGVWYHVEICRSGNNILCFVNGSQIGTTQTATVGTIRTSTSLMTIGGGLAGGAVSINGWLDEYRISIGVARHITGFTPPIGEYTE